MKYTVPASANPTVLNIVPGVQPDPLVTIDAPPATNKPPIVTITAPVSITLPATLTLTATATDPDGTITKYAWTKDSGGAATITTPAASKTTVTALVPGVYIFGCTVTDDKGSTATVGQTIEVKPAIVVEPPAPGSYLTLAKGTKQTYDNKTNLVIENLQFSGTGNLLTFNSCTNVVIRKCYFSGADIGISVYKGQNITVEDCLFVKNGTGVRAEATTGNVIVRNCQFVNGQWKFSIARAQHIQFALIGGTGNLIENCKGENFKGESGAEDLVSLYGSKNVIVRNNIFRGGGRFGTSEESSGGIMLGDQGGENLTAEGNKVINVGHYGLCISGGTNNKLINNMAYADANNAAILNTIGFFIYNAGGTTCSGAAFSGNKSNWSITAALPNTKNNFWNSGDCGTANISAPGSLTLAEMSVPAHLITFLTPTELLKVRAL